MEKMSNYFPEELIEEIFSRLPVKSILRFSCVCKSWNSIIRKPDFTFSSNKHGHLLLHRFNEQCIYNKNHECSLRLDNKDFSEHMSIHPLFDGSAGYVRMAGSCNGLVCLFRGDKLILWNPSIKKTMQIPKPNFNFYKLPENLFGIGFDSKNNDYKVIRIMLNSYISGTGLNSDAFLYSLSSNSWKKIANITGKYRYSQYFDVVTPSVFVKDTFYWPVIKENKNIILAFNLDEEVFRDISLPEFAANPNGREVIIKAYGESSIALIHQNYGNSCESHLWVLKKENINSEWIKLATIGKHWRGSSRVLEFRNNGEALLQFTGRGYLASYNIEKGRFKTLIGSLAKHERISAHKYIETFALFDKGKYVKDAAATDTNSAKRRKRCS